MVIPSPVNAEKLLRQGWLLEYHCREWSAALQHMPYDAREMYDYGHIATQGRGQPDVCCFFCHEYILRDKDGRLFVAAGDFVIEEQP